MGAVSARAWNQPHDEPDVTWAESRCGYAMQRYVTITGDEFSIRLAPDVADNLADRIKRCAHLARTRDANAPQITDHNPRSW